MDDIIYYYEIVFIFYFVLISLGYILLNYFGFTEIKKYLKKREFLYWPKVSNKLEIPISILAPAYNEELTIVESIKSMLNLDFNEYEVVVICDGPKDNTLGVLINAYNLIEVANNVNEVIESKKILKIYLSPNEPKLKVVLKENGGKADALNCGINVSRYPLFCAIDADSLLSKDSLQLLVDTFIKDEATVAAGGMVRIVNGSVVENGNVTSIKSPKKWIERIQIVEYLRAFFLGRMGWAKFDSILIISGAFGLFKKNIVIQAGGYNTKTVGEDMDLVLRLRDYTIRNNLDGHIAFVPEAICWTQCPNDYKTLKNQRARWQRGLLECLATFKQLLFNKKGGAASYFAFPFFWIAEVFGPIIEFFGYIGVTIFWLIGAVDFEVVVLFYLFSVSIGLLLSVGSIFTEEYFFENYTKRQATMLLVSAIAENFIYRYLHLYWRIKGTYQYLTKKGTWGEMKRTKFN